MNGTAVTMATTHHRRRTMAQYTRSSTIAQQGIASGSRNERPARPSHAAQERAKRADARWTGLVSTPPMRRFRFRLTAPWPVRRWRLRIGLLAPILVLVPLALAATALSWEA